MSERARLGQRRFLRRLRHAHRQPGPRDRRPAAPTASGPGVPAGGWPAPPPAPSLADEPCPNCGTPRTGQFCEACGYNFAGPRLAPGPPPPAPVRAGGYSQPTPAPGPGAGGGGYSWSQPVPSAPSRPSAPPSPAVTLPPPAREPAAGGPPVSSFPYPQATWTAIVGADHAYYERVQAVTGPEGAAVTFPGLLRRAPLPARREPDEMGAAAEAQKAGPASRQPGKERRRPGTSRSTNSTVWKSAFS